MTPQQTLLTALADQPGDTLTQMALADCLEEAGELPRAELTRLTLKLCRLHADDPLRMIEANRINELLVSGVRPCVPEIFNSVQMRLVLIPAGRFLMGSPANEESRHEDEWQHPVEISRPFWIGANLVTQGQFKQVMGFNPSAFTQNGVLADRVIGLNTQSFPVDSVSWHTATEFCERLTQMEQGRRYRLPTEAEWEYACRAGMTTAFSFGTAMSSLIANFDGKSPFLSRRIGPDLNRTTAVGSYPPNAWGVHDMHGNLDEWCGDWYEENFYRHGPLLDPEGPDQGEMRVMRGGTWGNSARFCRSAFRWRASPEVAQTEKGFRVVCECRG